MYLPTHTWPPYYPTPAPYWPAPPWGWPPPFWPQPCHYWPPPAVWCGEANATQVGKSLATARPTA